MRRQPTFIELLKENIIDWFYTNCGRTCYESDDDYIDDIRYMIANKNDKMITDCIDGLVNVYHMNYDYVFDHNRFIIDTLINESQVALDNFSYGSDDD